MNRAIKSFLLVWRDWTTHPQRYFHSCQVCVYDCFSLITLPTRFFVSQIIAHGTSLIIIYNNVCWTPYVFFLAYLISSAVLMTGKITQRTFIRLFEAQYFMAFLAYLCVHNVDFDVLMRWDFLLHFMQAHPISPIGTRQHEIVWHHLNNSLIMISWSWAARWIGRRRIDEWEILIAYAQYKMLWPQNVVVVVLCRSLIVNEQILVLAAAAAGAFRLTAFHFHIWQRIIRII